MRLNCQAKNQIVIPREARNALGLKAGAKLLIVVRHNTVVLLRKPKVIQRGSRAWRRGFIRPITWSRKERAGQERGKLLKTKGGYGKKQSEEKRGWE